MFKYLGLESTENINRSLRFFQMLKIGSNSTPTIFQEYAEVEFYLAEAALRGWGPGTPKEHFEKAARANMAKSKDVPYPGGFSISTAAVDTYLAAHPYNSGGTFEESI